MVTSDAMEFSEKLKYLMKEHRYSQAKVAEAADVSQSLVSNWANGKGLPNLYEAARIANLFGVELSYLADDGQDMPASDLGEREKAVIGLLNALGLETDEAIRRLATPLSTAAGMVAPDISTVDSKPLPPSGPTLKGGKPAYTQGTSRKKQPG